MIQRAREFPIGPVTRLQLEKLGRVWEQGQHVLVTGGTGSGKTELARRIVEERSKRGGFIVVFVGKLRPDETITRSYAGWTRWTNWKKRPGIHENRILLWPKVEGLPLRQALPIFRRTFMDAMDAISVDGKWTVQFDEGLFMSSPHFLNLGSGIGMMHQLLRSNFVTLVTLAQRAAHLPVSIYPNIDHAFVGRASEGLDIKRLADLDGLTSSRELQRIIAANGKHDFTWIPVSQEWPPEQVNLKR